MHKTFKDFRKEGNIDMGRYSEKEVRRGLFFLGGGIISASFQVFRQLLKKGSNLEYGI